jgi:hypothetical protein
LKTGTDHEENPAGVGTLATSETTPIAVSDGHRFCVCSARAAEKSTFEHWGTALMLPIRPGGSLKRRSRGSATALGNAPVSKCV